MPVYDYKCDSCGNRFDRRQGYHDDPIRVCPNCGGVTRRIIHAPSVVFKGSGFYKTDSRVDPAAKADKDDTKSDTPAEKTDGAPGETPGDKPADKPADKPSEKPTDKPSEKPADKPTETKKADPAPAT